MGNQQRFLIGGNIHQILSQLVECFWSHQILNLYNLKKYSYNYILNTFMYFCQLKVQMNQYRFLFVLHFSK